MNTCVGHANITIIIPTYNRPSELEVCIRSILGQTVLPREMIIVDDGKLHQVPLASQIRERYIDLRYFKKGVPGLTRSRNLGISKARGKILFFLDDDVKLFDTYIEKILSVYATMGDNTACMGVGGMIEALTPFTRLQAWRYRIDRFLGISGPVEGRLLRCGTAVDYGDSGKTYDAPWQVDFLPGGVCSYRREVFEEFMFSPRYIGYGMGEDKDFSFRVSRKWRLMATPHARLYHYESPKMRQDVRQETRQVVMGRYRLFCDYLHRNRRDTIRFYWGVLAYLTVRCLIFCRYPGKKSLDRIMGIMLALKALLIGGGRCPKEG